MPDAVKRMKRSPKPSVADALNQVSPDLATDLLDDSISTSLAIIVQDLQMLERRLLPGSAANQAVAEELGISLESVHEYLKRRNVYDFISGMRRAGRRMSRSLNSIG